jgi:hypothetical protein
MMELSNGDQAIDVLRQFFSCKHIDLDYLVYAVRDRELQGWDGPAVKAWSDAMQNARAVLKRADEERRRSSWVRFSDELPSNGKYIWWFDGRSLPMLVEARDFCRDDKGAWMYPRAPAPPKRTP